MKKLDIEFVKQKNRDVMLLHMVNKKNRTKKTKDLPIPIDKEPKFIATVKDYLNRLDDESKLFQFTKQRAWQILTKELGFNPHFIRHIRLSHMVINYDFNDQLLVRFAGWSDSRPAKHYMELNWKDFLEKY